MSEHGPKRQPSTTSGRLSIHQASLWVLRLRFGYGLQVLIVPPD